MAAPPWCANGSYAPGELHRATTYDENHTEGKDHSTEEFTDKEGRTVLKRTYNEGEAHDTHYVYDDYGNLVYVVPPKATVTETGVSAVELSGLCYRYVYDHRNRLVEKELPGKGREQIVYNKLDLPILVQDAHLRERGLWLFTKYDALGRAAYTGFYEGGPDRAAVQALADAHGAQYEGSAPPVPLGGGEVPYGNAAFPTEVALLLTVNRYDAYGLAGAPGAPPANDLGTALLTGSALQGLATGTRVRVLGTDHWETTVTGYDAKRRPVYVRRANTYLDAVDTVHSKLDFLGRAQQVKSVHAKGGNDPIATLDTFTYDATGRLLEQQRDLGGHRETIVANTYDPMGLLVGKKVGGSGGRPLQDIELDYNIRGWLTGINAPDLDARGRGRLFRFGIHYDSGANYSDPLYNGNIASTEWSSRGRSTKRRFYRYGYDALNRLTSALDASGRFHVGAYGKPITYDRNGNILSMYRKGHTSDNPVDGLNSGYGNMDDLVYEYDGGNRLLSVSDRGDKGYGFVDGTNTGNDYDYDANGNMTLDRNKGITSIEYNHLNLPTKVTINGNGNNGTIDYIYLADGTKLEKLVTDTAEGSLTATEYCGGYVYEKIGSGPSRLQFFPQPEGYIEPKRDAQGNITGWEYVYQYLDHLGNVRLSYSDANGDGIASYSEIREENHYYPFGLKHKGYNSRVNGRDHKYGLTSKEEQDELDLRWIDFGVRNYDESLGRWFNIDPMTDKREWLSPYQYVQNSPMWRIDPDGAFDIYIDAVTGKELGRDGRVSDDIRIIDSADFSDIQDANNGSTISAEATKQLQNSSTLVTVDDAQIQDAVQNVNDTSRTIETQVNIVLDRDTGVVSAVQAPPGTDGNTNISYEARQDKNRVSYSTSGGNLLIGQVHGHNKLQQSNKVNEPGTSIKDANAANNSGANIYAVGAYNTPIGGAANIYKVTPGSPLAPQVNKVGETKGNIFNPGKTINIGRDALKDYIVR